MGKLTSISWADGTWNVITGCSLHGPGCQRCYAMKLAGGRLKNHPSRVGLTIPTPNGPVWTGEVRFNRRWLYDPLRVREPQSWFVVAHGDLFHEGVPDSWIDEIHGVIAAAPWHLFFVLTKRIARARQYYNAPGLDSRIFPAWAQAVVQKPHPGQGKMPSIPFPNLWLGTSTEGQPQADERVPELLATPAALHWLSVEPMLEPVDLRPDWLRRLRLVVAGGESQAGARWLPANSVRRLRDQVIAYEAEFHFKQWGAWLPRDQVTTAEQRSAVFNAEVKWLTGEPPNGAVAYRVGPKVAGHLLDGVEYRGMPAWQPA
jgi:protein gp37